MPRDEMKHGDQRRKAPHAERINREISFNMRLSKSEKERLDENMKREGFNNLSDYIRHTMLQKPPEASVRDLLKPDGQLFSDKTLCDLAVAILHQYQIEQMRYASMDDDGSGRDYFAKGRRKVIEHLGLEKLYGG